MLHEFLVVLGQVATLFLMMGAGYVLGKKGHMPEQTTKDMSYVLLYVVTPCIMVDTLQTEMTGGAMLALLAGAAALVVCYGVQAVLALTLFRKQPRDRQAPLRFGSVYGNTGFMGLPLVQAVLGKEALIYAVVTMVIFNLFSWTHGVVLMGGRENFSLKKAILNPGVIGFLLGAPLLILQLRLPAPVHSAVGFLADLNTPLAMLVVGAQMSRARLDVLFKKPELYAASAVKLLAVPLVTLLLLTPLHLDRLFFVTAVILAATPTAGVTSMFALRFGRDEETSAQLVTLGTLLSVITLPCIGLLAQTIAH